MEVSDLNKLLKMQRQMSDVMKKMGKGGMLKQAMRGMFGKGMPDPSELSGKLDSKALQKAAKDLGNMSPNNIPGGLSGLGGGQLPPGLSGFGKKK
ncbi:MAG: signal recognition particle protein, partial [Paracoccaceae bacterium]|jgi:signal recognition particle subunit SRP54